jgi:uroporphyrinogen III methyltransferase/synthase
MSAGLTAARPLTGRVIVVTRAFEQARRLAALLEDAGGSVLSIPTIAIEPPASWAPLDGALARSREYQWVVFTSVNGVEMVRRRLEGSGRGRDALASCRIAAIGPATADALLTWGLAAEAVPEEFVAESLVERLRPLIRGGDRVLLPRAAEARDVLVRELTAMGALVTEAPAYRTRPAMERAASLREALRGGTVDAVTFTSSSTVRNFVALLDPGARGSLMSRIAVACIGPVTAATAATFGLATQIMPAEYTIPALARAITAYFEAQRS